MQNIKLTGKVIAYGTPPLLIVLGTSVYTGGKFVELVSGSSEGMTTVGGLLIAFGIGMGLIELFLKFR